MAKQRDPLIEEIVTAMRDIARLRASSPAGPWLHLDLTLPQLKALFLLDSAGDARPSEIAEAIGVTATGVTGLLDRLEERGFIGRTPDPRDRRAIAVQLTPAGHALLDEIHATNRDQMLQVLARLEEDDLRALHRGIRALVTEQTRMRDERALDATEPEQVAGGRTPAVSRG